MQQVSQQVKFELRTSSGGMHYTSPENIHKVIDPLFLDGLREELDAILSQEGLTPCKRKNALRKFRKKLTTLKFLEDTVV